jgi:hypothetical protein
MLLKPPYLYVVRVYSHMVNSASTKTVLAIWDGAHLSNDTLTSVTPLILFLGGLL